MEHDWPGNVRELRNAIERAMILEGSALIARDSLPLTISHRTAPAMAAASPSGAATTSIDGLSLEHNERNLIQRDLDQTKNNQTQAAKLLHVTRDTLRYKMKKFNLR